METEKKVSVLYVCTAKGCDYSLPVVGVDGQNGPRIVMAKNRKGENVPTLQSPPYGTISAGADEKPVCPNCGAVCTELEDDRHKALRVLSPRIQRTVEQVRLIRNVLKGSQYDLAVDDLNKLRKILYAEMDALQHAIDTREERITSPTGRVRDSKVKAVKIPFAL